MTRTITITGYRRPLLFRGLLASLTANDLAGWHIHVRVEPTPAAEAYLAVATEMLADRPFTLTVNPERLGVRRNPFALLQDVFAGGSELNIYLEEDQVVSPDLIRLVDWFAAHRQADWLCLSLLAGGCGSPGLISDADHPDQLFLSKAFNSLGFAVTREQWHRNFEPHWMTDDPSCCAPTGEKAVGWDWAIYFRLFADPALHTVQPVLARATHTGREDGEHCHADFHDLAFGDLAVADGRAAAASYRLVPIGQLPPLVRRHALLWQQAVQSLAALAEKERTIDGLHAQLAAQEAGRQAAQQRGDRLASHVEAAQMATAAAQAELARRMAALSQWSAERLAVAEAANARARAELGEALRASDAQLNDERRARDAQLNEGLRALEAQQRQSRHEIDQLRTELGSHAATLQRGLAFLRMFIASGARPAWWDILRRPALLSAARRAARRRDWPAAERAYRTLLGLWPRRSKAWVQYGHVLKQQGRPAHAEAAYREALALNGGTADHFVQLGHALKLQGLTADAELAYLQAHDRDPDLAAPRGELLQLGWTAEALAARTPRTREAAQTHAHAAPPGS